MSFNLVQAFFSSRIPRDLAGQVAPLLNLGPDDVNKTVSTAVAALTGGILRMGRTPLGARQLFDAVAGPSVDQSLLWRTGGLFAGGAETDRLLTGGLSLINTVFGDKASDLTSVVAEESGVGGSKAASLLQMVMPILLAFLKGHVQSEKLSLEGFTKFLATQAESLQGLLSEKLSDRLGWGPVGPFLAALAGGKTEPGAPGEGRTALGGATAPLSKAEEESKSGWGWLWLLPLLLLGIFVWRSCGQQTSETPVPAPAKVAPSPALQSPPPVAPAAAPTPTPTEDAKLSLIMDEQGRAKVTGSVANDAEKSTLLGALKTAFGDKFGAEIDVSNNVRAAPWLAKLGELLGLINRPGGEFSAIGSLIKLGGSLADPKLGLVDKLKGLFGVGFDVSATRFDLAGAISEATKKFTDAVQSLQADACDEGLVPALNLQVINFAPGSAQVPKNDAERLRKVVPAIKACAKTLKMEVSGHTDNTGTAQGNAKLSENRARAVRALLVKSGVPSAMLTAKGFGSEKPIADNITEEGRFRNRRIEFTATP